MCANSVKGMNAIMANLASNFTDALIFIYDSNNNLITKTFVTGHNRGEMYIEISEGLERVKPKTRLNLLILHSSGASELSGFLKSVRQGIFEISIFRERQRDLRTSVRHRLNASAVISDMIIETVLYDDDEIALNTEAMTIKETLLGGPIAITIEDLSSTGMLIKSRHIRFDMAAILKIEFVLHGKDVILYGAVVREQVHKNDVYRYGCKLYFPN